MPGATALTRMTGPYSRAADAVSAMTPALAAEYGRLAGRGPRGADRRRVHHGAAAPGQQMGDTGAHAVEDPGQVEPDDAVPLVGVPVRPARAMVLPPALLTRIDTPPSCGGGVVDGGAHGLGVGDVHRRWPRRRSPRPSPGRRRRRCRGRPRAAPWAAKRRQTARPMPDPPPVTTARWPTSRPMSADLLGRRCHRRSPVTGPTSDVAQLALRAPCPGGCGGVARTGTRSGSGTLKRGQPLPDVAGQLLGRHRGARAQHHGRARPPRPRTAWGTPITAQSATAGCSNRAASTSTEYTFSPPRMTMSLARSTM